MREREETKCGEAYLEVLVVGGAKNLNRGRRKKDDGIYDHAYSNIYQLQKLFY